MAFAQSTSTPLAQAVDNDAEAMAMPSPWTSTPPLAQALDHDAEAMATPPSPTSTVTPSCTSAMVESKPLAMSPPSRSCPSPPVCATVADSTIYAEHSVDETTNSDAPSPGALSNEVPENSGPSLSSGLTPSLEVSYERQHLRRKPGSSDGTDQPARHGFC
ncbi:hypothetical protein B0H14DRAFT_1923 [Mycena olivaceomarginata]|nr:hypothetical protein B0H14DRAFT_1923 [Mycena olivaceomarginata]